MIGEACHIVEADIRRSVIGRNVHIEAGARLDECVIMDGVRIGARARLHRVIADRFSSIPANSEIGPYRIRADRYVMSLQAASWSYLATPRCRRR